jgi:hypothetical protein
MPLSSLRKALRTSQLLAFTTLTPQGGSYYCYTTITAMDITTTSRCSNDLTILMSSGTFMSPKINYITTHVSKYETIHLTETQTTDENDTLRITSIIAIRPIWEGTTFTVPNFRH